MQQDFKNIIYANLLLLAILMFTTIMLVITCTVKEVFAEETQASYYSVESCKREGTWQKYEGRMANGRIFDDNEMVCASWDYPFGTKLRVVNMANKKTVVVEVADRGPSKKLYRKGRKLDLSEGAFSKIADTKQGVISVQVEKL